VLAYPLPGNCKQMFYFVSLQYSPKSIKKSWSRFFRHCTFILTRNAQTLYIDPKKTKPSIAMVENINSIRKKINLIPQEHEKIVFSRTEDPKKGAYMIGIHSCVRFFMYIIGYSPGINPLPSGVYRSLLQSERCILLN
jgi:hypothetical protein